MRFLLSRLATLLLCVGLTGCTTVSNPAAKQESAMDRVVRTGSIRCGYLPYASYFRKDPNTGKLSGVFYDVMEEVGKNAGLKIEWVEEVGYQSIFPALESKRFDVFAGGLWPNASRAKAAAFSTPVCYSAISAWVRPGDTRFKKDLGLINSEAVKIATIDGAMENFIAKSDFPKAQRLSLPELSPFSENLLNVIHKKADVTFAEPMSVHEFLVTNPNTLEQLAPDKPLRVFGNCLAVKGDEYQLRDFLNVGLTEIINDGRMDKIIASYKLPKGTFFPLTRPYQLPQ